MKSSQVYDYLSDSDIASRIKKRCNLIRNRDDRIEFKDKAYLELYDFQPYSRYEAYQIIDRVYNTFIYPDDEDEV